MTFINYIKDKFFSSKFTQREQFIGDANLLDENYVVAKKNPPNEINQKLAEYSYMAKEDLFEYFDSTIEGLDTFKIEKLQKKYGFNEIDEHKKLSWYKHLWLCYKNPFNLLLTFLDIFFIITNDIRGTFVISLMIIVSTILRFVQEKKSNNAADKLKQLVSTTVAVIRRNVLAEVAIKQLVPGDIIRLSAGDLIPADVRILSAKDLFISQAALTGESLPVEKFSQQKTQNITNPLELDNIGFMGTNVISGSAVAIILSTAKYTMFGALANKVIKIQTTNTRFQIGINRISMLLIYFMLIMSPIVFIINGLTKHDWMSALMFALSIAVGLTPEMLPMIVTSTLAKGAVIMSRRKVIVKRLDAIQAFGEMNILCTDKTGTLTQDKICLERHTDIMGDNCDGVLEYAYLNSYYQTGLKNLLDVAVLAQDNFGNIPKLSMQYKKIDEVPFDFQRRVMSVVVEDIDSHGHILICKGAVEEITDRVTHALYKDQLLDLDITLRDKLKKVTASLNSDGLRVVAVAIKKYSEVKEVYSVSDECNMTLVGYIAFMDPPKETTKPAIEALHRQGVNIKILTGDNELVTAKVCREVGLDINSMILGGKIDNLDDIELARIAQETTVFAKLTPEHKERIVKVLKNNGNTVGFMGDGINDAPALRTADIGISVDSAVDIAKEAADIILLEKSLMVLEKGVREGRKTFANMLKYIKIAASSNFGNVFTILIASAFIPFEPMLPVQLLILNLLCDIAQTAIPFDNVDNELLTKPEYWDVNQLKRFILFFGPISSIFDIATFAIMWWFYQANTLTYASLFQSGWFVESLVTQIMIVHMLRTRKIPFIQSMASSSMIIMMIVILCVGIMLPMISETATYFKMQALPISYFVWLSVIVIGYLWLSQVMKNIYTKRYGAY